MRQFLFNLKWRFYKPAVFPAYREALRFQYLPSERLQESMENKKRAIVEHAVKHTEFYKKFYADAGFDVSDIGKYGWFENLPVVTKDHLRTHFEEFFDRARIGDRAISTTGGSTGTPTRTGYDKRVPLEAIGWRFQGWFGVNPWDDHAYVWRQSRSPRAELINAILWWPTRHLKLDASLMTECSILEFIRRYNRLKPTLLEGYVGAITQLAQFILDHEIPVHSPKCVWMTSAPITEVQKRLVKIVFRAPILNQYGSCEVASIAQSCEKDCGLHVNVDRVCIEYVNDAYKPVPVGEYGRALLTNLVDKVFPLIRYENGDRGRWLGTTCPCGRTLPLIDSVKGRESESFKLPSGKIVSGEYLTTIFDARPEIVRGFRVVQHADSSITVECIPSSNDSISAIHEIVKSFSGKLGHEVPVDCKVVESLSHDRGKMRFVVSEKTK